ncbi:MAG: HD domain-containing phosphohydrolase [Anaerolineales bacterium]|nr:HD domain-containing phosphohydrolase [Anaerolineales bacterium]
MPKQTSSPSKQPSSFSRLPAAFRARLDSLQRRLAGQSSSFPKPGTAASLRNLRARLLNLLLLSGAIIGTVLYVSALLPSFEKGLYTANVIYTIVYLWLLVVTFFRRIVYWIRASSLLFILYILGVTNLFYSGLNVDAGLFLLTFIVMTSLLIGLRGGLGTIVLSSLSVAALGFLVVDGALTPSLRLPQENPMLWVIGGLVLLLTGILLTISLKALVSGLETSLVEASALTEELEQANETLRASEADYRSIFENAAEGIFQSTPGDRFLRINPAMARIYGYASPQEMATSVGDIKQGLYVNPAQREEWQRILQENGSVTGFESEEYRKDGSMIWVLSSTRAVRDASGAVLFYEGMLEDITERKRAEEQIQRQFKRLSALRTIDAAISGSHNLRLTLEITLAQIVTQLGVDAADVLLLDPHTQILEYAAGRGFRTPALQHTKLRLGQGYAGIAGLERKTILVTDLRSRKTDFLRSPYFKSEGFDTCCCVPLIAKGETKGVLEIFHRQPVEGDSEWQVFLETLAEQVAIAVDSAQLFTNLQRSNADLALAYDTTLEGWSKALDLRDRETEDHTQRVTEMTLKLARGMGISDVELMHVRRGALLHDIGKMGVPDSILLKPAKLTDEEWVIMRSHPQFAYNMLSSIEFLRPALDIPYCHHEKWDGTGYPRGLKGEQIPLAARIFAVVDVWDALNSNRPYRKAWSREKTLEYVKTNSGTHFDPKVVEAFLRLQQGEE